jgi:hypothetical protein
MKRGDGAAVADLATRFDVPYVGAIPYDETVEEALGDVIALRRTRVYAVLQQVADSYLR